jgi:uncharacterized membrane protein YdjX (TVP38/TMEM64 family)
MTRLVLLFVAAALLVAAPFFIFGDSFETFLSKDRLIDAFSAYRGYAWIVAILLMVADILLPIPNTMVIVAMGIVYGPFLGGLVSAGGLALSGFAGYGLCRVLGRPAALWLLGERELHEAERLFLRVGGLLVAASRWAPILAEAIACLAGLAGMPLRTFGLALLSGVVPFAFAIAGLGYAGSDRPILTLVICALLPLPIWFVVRGAFLRRPSGGEGDFHPS